MQPKDTKPTTVIKVGGARLVSPDDLASLVDHIARLRSRGERVVVVHGGGPEISRLHERLGVSFEKRGGVRVTKGEGMDIAQMVLCGLVNKRIVAHCLAGQVPAVGLSGVDGGLLLASVLDADTWGRVGRAPQVDTRYLEEILGSNRVPIVAPISLADDWEPVNVNADDAAHAIAAALAADSLDFISDIPGVKNDKDAVIPRIETDKVCRLIESGIVAGGMIPKLEAAVIAIEAGVGRVRIGDLEAMGAETATEVAAAS